MFIDSNGNGILDDSDKLISKDSLRSDFARNDLGGLSQKALTLYSKNYESHGHSDHGHTEHDHGTLFSHMGNPESVLGIEHMSFMNLNNTMVLHDVAWPTSMTTR